MPTKVFVIEFMKAAYSILKISIPAFIIGVHLPQPPWIKKKVKPMPQVGILDVISEVLVLINKFVPDQSTEIANKILSLRQKWDTENAKSEADRDDNMLDCIESELRDIRQLFSSAITTAASLPKS